MGFKYIDLFSGIGGFRVGLDAVGGTSVGFSEIDKKAIETYKMNFNDPDSHNLGDVTKVTVLPETDLIVGGVPCQSWSVAGKKRGFDDPRGRLWYDAIRMVEIAKPKAFIFENVKGLVDPRNIANIQLIVESLEEIGYVVMYQLLNSYDFGAPQNRSRVFVVGFRNDLKNAAALFSYPVKSKPHTSVGKLIEGLIHKDIKKTVFDPFDIHGTVVPKSRNAFQKVDELNDFFIFCDTRGGHSTIHSWDIYQTSDLEKKICIAIMKNRRKKKYGNADGNPLSLIDIKALVPQARLNDIKGLVKKKILKETSDKKYGLLNSKNSSGIDGIYRIFLPNSPIFSTLTATGTRDFIATDYLECDDPKKYKKLFIEKIYKKSKFRQVSAREAARIQGFPETFVCHESDYSAQKQFGNAVSPPVVKALAEQILATGIFENTQNIKMPKDSEIKGVGLSSQQLSFESITD